MSRDESVDLNYQALQAKEGDQAAFVILYREMFPRIFRYVALKVPGPEVEDMVGDVFLKVVAKLDQYHPVKAASFSAWVYRIAHNTIIDYYRKKKDVFVSASEEEEGERFWDALPDHHLLLPSEDVDQGLERDKIHEALGKLRPNYREILDLKFLEGFSNYEIAEITGKKEGNVRILQMRALEELRGDYGRVEDNALRVKCCMFRVIINFLFV